MTLMLHNYRLRQFHRTWNGINPSNDFKDIGSAKSGLSAAWFDKFLAHGQAHMGQMGKWPWQCTTRGLDNSTEPRMEKIRQAVTEIWVPQVWQPSAQPPPRPPRPWRQYPSSSEGWGVKMTSLSFQCWICVAGKFWQHSIFHKRLKVIKMINWLKAKDTNSTRTTRTPAFWGYTPLPHDYPHCWVMLDPKSKQGRMTLK